jgi:methylglutaconyl-CoA hydratase
MDRYGHRLFRSGPDDVIARVTLARPEVRNAFNAELIAALRATFDELANEPPEHLRAVVLAGDGPAFSAGADIAWQRASLALSLEENQTDAGHLFDMLAAIDTCPVPVIARVQGAALGGGMGLCCVADRVVAAADARFGFTETKLGILPATIAPFVVGRIGEGWARALFPTGERFDAARAKEIGLVHDLVVDQTALDARVEEIVGELMSAGPTAARAAKRVSRAVESRNLEDVRALVVAIASQQRVSPEGQEGLSAFLDKRRASWRLD